MRQWRQNTLPGFYPPLLRCHSDNHTPCPASHKIARQFLHYDRYRVACGLERPLPSIYMHIYTLYMYVRTICIRSIRNKRRTNFGEDRSGPCACDALYACAADHVINSSRPSVSVFPPPHLIITRNAHRGGRRPGNEANLDRV